MTTLLRRVLWITGVLVMLSGIGQLQAQSTIQKSYVIGAGGAPATDGMVVINGTFGQSAIGQVASIASINQQGFWYSIPSSTSGVEELPISGAVTGSGVRLLQNIPNPFTESTEIRFEIPRSTFVSLKLYDGIGREALTLVEGNREAGAYSVRLGAADLESGQYVAQLVADGTRRTIVMIVVK